jgi:hypothetical protein
MTNAAYSPTEGAAQSARMASAPLIREASIKDLIRNARSPAHTLQESLFDRLETDGIITRWPPQMRYSLILLCAAACWAAILLPLSLI